MTSSFPVKYVNNAMRGAPQISGTPGTYLNAMRAFLITGFGQVTAISVTVADGIATAALQAGQSFDPYCVVLIEGATPAALNGEARVLASSGSSINWATTAPDGVATGSIKIKVAPVGGWEESFAGTVANVGVFRSLDPQASGFFVRIDDTGALDARVVGYETMADASTGTGAFPSPAQLSGGGFCFKSNIANASAVRYDFFADSRLWLSAVAAGSSASTANISAPLRGFGDLLALRPGGDTYSCALSCVNAAGSNSGYFHGSFDGANSSGGAIFMPRAPSGMGGSVQVGSKPYVGSVNGVSGQDSTLGSFPSSVDGELKCTNRYVHSGDGSTPRCDIPGVAYVPQMGLWGSIAPRDILIGTGLLAGRRLLAIPTSSGGANQAATGIVLVDTTGPWR